MAHDAASAEFDIDCLRHVVADEEVRRTSLAAAMIKMRALAIARADPSARPDALEIVRNVERLYPALPSRPALRAIIRRHLAMPSGPGTDGIDRLADAIWHHFRDGQG